MRELTLAEKRSQEDFRESTHIGLVACFALEMHAVMMTNCFPNETRGIRSSLWPGVATSNVYIVFYLCSIALLSVAYALPDAAFSTWKNPGVETRESKLIYPVYALSPHLLLETTPLTSVLSNDDNKDSYVYHLPNPLSIESARELKSEPDVRKKSPTDSKLTPEKELETSSTTTTTTEATTTTTPAADKTTTTTTTTTTSGTLRPSTSEPTVETTTTPTTQTPHNEGPGAVCRTYGVAFDTSTPTQVVANTQTLTECESACSMSSACAVASFDWKLSKCNFYSGSLDDLSLVASPWSLLSRTDCSETQLCAKVGIWYTSSTPLELYSGVSLWECSSKCSGNSQCVLASYDFQHRDCVLLESSESSATTRILGDRYVTFLRNCPENVQCSIQAPPSVRYVTQTPPGLSYGHSSVGGYSVTTYTCVSDGLVLVPPVTHHLCQPDGTFLEPIVSCIAPSHRIALLNDASVADNAFKTNFLDNLKSWLTVSGLPDYEPRQKDTRPLADYLQDVSTLLLPLAAHNNDASFEERLAVDPSGTSAILDFVTKGGVIIYFLQDRYLPLLFNWTVPVGGVCDTQVDSGMSGEPEIFRPKTDAHTIAYGIPFTDDDIVPLLTCNSQQLSPLVRKKYGRGTLIGIGLDPYSTDGSLARDTWEQALLQVITQFSQDPVKLPGLPLNADDVCHFYGGDTSPCSSENTAYCSASGQGCEHSTGCCSSDIVRCREASIPCIAESIKPTDDPKCPTVTRFLLGTLDLKPGTSVVLECPTSSGPLVLSTIKGEEASGATAQCTSDAKLIIEWNQQLYGLEELMCLDTRSRTLVLGQERPGTFLQVLAVLEKTMEESRRKLMDSPTIRRLTSPVDIHSVVIPPVFFRSELDNSLLQQLETFVKNGGIVLDMAGATLGLFNKLATQNDNNSPGSSSKGSLMKPCNPLYSAFRIAAASLLDWLASHGYSDEVMASLRGYFESTKPFLSSSTPASSVLLDEVEGIPSSASEKDILPLVQCPGKDGHQLDLSRITALGKGIVFLDLITPQLFWSKDNRPRTTPTLGYPELLETAAAINRNLSPQETLEFDPPKNLHPGGQSTTSAPRTPCKGCDGDTNANSSRLMIIGGAAGAAVLLGAGAAVAGRVLVKKRKKTAQQQPPKREQPKTNPPIVHAPSKRITATDSLRTRGHQPDLPCYPMKKESGCIPPHENKIPLLQASTLPEAHRSSASPRLEPAPTDQKDSRSSQQDVRSKEAPPAYSAALAHEIAGLRKEMAMIQHQLDTYTARPEDHAEASRHGEGGFFSHYEGSTLTDNLSLPPLFNRKPSVTPSTLENAFSPEESAHPFELDGMSFHSVSNMTDCSNATAHMQRICNYGPTLADLDAGRRLSQKGGRRSKKRGKRSSGFLARPHTSVRKGLR